MPLLTLRSLCYHWKKTALIVAALTLIFALQSALIVSGDLIAIHGLRQTLSGQLSAESRNVRVTAPSAEYLDEAVYDDITARIGDVIVQRVDIAQVKLTVCDLHCDVDELDMSLPYHYVQLWAIEGLDNEVRVVDGRLPDNPSDSGVLEVAIGQDALARTGLGLGDVVRVTQAGRPMELTIVGIVEPLHPDADFWWDDPTTYGLRITPLGRSAELVTVSLFMPPQVMVANFANRIPTWRLMIDNQAITIDNADRLIQKITNLQAQLATRQVELGSGLPRVLAEFQQRQAVVLALIVLLTGQITVMSLYLLWLFAGIIVNSQQSQLFTLRARGVSRFSVAGIPAVYSLGMFLIASILGPALALLGRGALRGTSGVPLRPSLWFPSMATAAVGCLMVTVRAFILVHKPLPVPGLDHMGRPHQPFWQRYFVDGLLLAGGGSLTWQMVRAGSLLGVSGGTLRTDPVLLFSSTMLLTGALLLAIRLSKVLFTVLALLASCLRPLPAFAGLKELSGRAEDYGWAMFPVLWVTTLVVFASLFTSSLTHSQTETARYLAGADVRVAAPHVTDPAVVIESSQLPGVTGVSPVIRVDARSTQSRTVDLLAVDPDTFAAVAHSPPNWTPAAMTSYLDALRDNSPRIAPALISRSLVTSSTQPGDEVELYLGTYEVQFEVRAIVDAFPTLSDRFMVTDWHALAEQIDLDMAYFRSGELWLSVEPGQQEDVISSLEGAVLASEAVEQDRLTADTVAAGIHDIFRLQSFILCGGGLLAAVLVSLAVYAHRRAIIDTLNQLGATRRELAFMLAVEYGLSVSTSGLIGAGLGIAAFCMLLPTLAGDLLMALNGVFTTRLITFRLALILPLVSWAAGYAVITMGVLIWRLSQHARNLAEG